MEFTDRMEAGKIAAMNRRNRGLHTGKQAAGWDIKPRYDEEGTWEATRYIVRLKWQLARDHAQQVYATAMFPERYADLEF